MGQSRPEIGVGNLERASERELGRTGLLVAGRIAGGVHPTTHVVVSPRFVARKLSGDTHTSSGCAEKESTRTIMDIGTDCTVVTSGKKCPFALS